MFRIDLNSDMGESFGAYTIGGDEEVIKFVTSANVACGFHAGDPMVMDRTVKMARERGVAVGAHPGYPDLQGFGRRKMALSPLEIKNDMKYQIGALKAFVEAEGMRLQHVAPHGALGNLCQYDRDASRAICEAVREVDDSLIVYRRGPWRGGGERGARRKGRDLCGQGLPGRPEPRPTQDAGRDDHRRGRRDREMRPHGQGGKGDGVERPRARDQGRHAVRARRRSEGSRFRQKNPQSL